ncbi:MAG TPA: SRPBCC family protein [Conexibacter sp.]|jgi:hypothetical protein
MAVARAALELPATAAAVEALWADVDRWEAFVDGFGRVVEREGAWPQAGARLVWESRPGGRGRVAEKVLRHEPGVELVTELEDPTLSGVQRLAFAPVAVGVEAGPRIGVALELDYALVSRSPFMVIADPLFVRRAVRDSLRRTLQRLANELG